MSQSYLHKQWPHPPTLRQCSQTNELRLKYLWRYSSHVVQKKQCFPGECFVRDSLLVIIDKCENSSGSSVQNLTHFSFFVHLSGQFERADRKGWDCYHGDRVEDRSLTNQLGVGGQHCCGFP